MAVGLDGGCKMIGENIFTERDNFRKFYAVKTISRLSIVMSSSNGQRQVADGGFYDTEKKYRTFAVTGSLSEAARNGQLASVGLFLAAEEQRRAEATADMARDMGYQVKLSEGGLLLAEHGTLDIPLSPENLKDLPEHLVQDRVNMHLIYLLLAERDHLDTVPGVVQPIA